MADKKSQRVAWTIARQQRPVMETGLANLTQDTSPALIHFADGQTQQVLMLRMPEDASPSNKSHSPVMPATCSHAIRDERKTVRRRGSLSGLCGALTSAACCFASPTC